VCADAGQVVAAAYLLDGVDDSIDDVNDWGELGSQKE
jgi:hypothetical protein